MSRSYQTNAININSYNLSENDKIIVMYSKDNGIIRCVAKGVKKPKSKLGGRMDLLINNNLVLSRGKNLDVVSQAEVLNGFKNIILVNCSCFLSDRPLYISIDFIVRDVRFL